MSERGREFYELKEMGFGELTTVKGVLVGFNGG